MDVRTKCAKRLDGTGDIGRPMAPAIVPSSTFDFEDQAAVDRYYESQIGYVYSRYGNPTVRQAERLVADLEEAEDAACFGSGMAAISTVVLLRVQAGDRIAAQRELYGGTTELLGRVLPGFGVTVTWLGVQELAELTPQRIAGCKLLYLETPTNPTLRIVDLPRAASCAREAGVLVAVDSTFASPILQRPLASGIDLVIHSATKYLGGHTDLIGGVVAGRAAVIEEVARRRRLSGGTMDPFSAFLLLRGMRTLAVRVDAQCGTAETVARFLERHPAVERVHYPGLDSHPDRALAARQMSRFGAMVAFEVAGGEEAAVRFHDRLRLISRAGSLGGIESLISIPAKMSHRHLERAERRAAGIGDGLVRLSVGLEAPDDLIADLDQALRANGTRGGND